MAAVLACGIGAVASCRTAGRLFVVDGVAAGPQVHVSVPVGRRPRHGGIIVHRVDLPRADVTKILSIPVTTPARTIIDLAGVLEEHPLEDALDCLVRRRLVHPRALQERLEAMDRRGRDGLGLLLRLVRERTTWNVSGSSWENKVRRAVVAAGLPEPVRQFVVTDEHGAFVARVDLAYPEKRLYIEYDGRQHGDPRQQAKDRDRQNRLSAVGWRPLRFIDEDLGSAAAIVGKVRDARRFS